MKPIFTKPAGVFVQFIGLLFAVAAVFNIYPVLDGESGYIIVPLILGAIALGLLWLGRQVIR